METRVERRTAMRLSHWSSTLRSDRHGLRASCGSCSRA